MPPAPALRQVRSQPGHRHVDDREGPDGGRGRGGHGKCRRAAPVMAGQMKARHPEMVLHQFQDVTGHGSAVVSGGRPGGVPEPAKVGRDHGIARSREVRNDPPPRIPGLGPAMQQHNRLAGAAGCDVVHGDLPQRRCPVLQEVAHGPNAGAGMPGTGPPGPGSWPVSLSVIRRAVHPRRLAIKSAGAARTVPGGRRPPEGSVPVQAGDRARPAGPGPVVTRHGSDGRHSGEGTCDTRARSVWSRRGPLSRHLRNGRGCFSC